MSKLYDIQIQSVVYHNEKQSLEETIASFANAIRVFNDRTGNKINANFIYGDSGSKRTLIDDDIILLKKLYNDCMYFSYVFFDCNTGSAKGQNILAKGYSGEYILIMNPDIKVGPYFFADMFNAFDYGEKIGIVEAPQMPIEHHKEYNKSSLETDWATGACSMIRKDVFDEVGGFDDDSFFMYCDDVDLSWRVRLAGWKIIYQPYAFVFHSKHLTSNALWMPTDAEKYYSAEAALMMSYKWSNDIHLKRLMISFARHGGVYKKALDNFQKRKKEGTLPRRLDKKHLVSKFNGFYYSPNRFTI